MGIYVNYFSDDLIMNIGMGISIVLFSFLFFLFASFVVSQFRKVTKRKTLKEYYPISILIPCYNEEKKIGQCIDSIISADYQKDRMEILVLDDGSKDDTLRVAKEKAKEYPEMDIRVLKLKHEGKSAAMNKGTQKAKYNLLITVDADITVEKDTLKKLVAPMQEDNVAATNAVAVIRKPKKLIEYFQMIEFTINNLIRTSFSRNFKNSIWFFGAVACYRKDVLNEVGGFKKDTLTEDMDICLEMFNKKYKIITVEDAFIFTDACPSVRQLFKQRTRWYFGALQSLFKNKQLLEKERRSPSIIFLFFNQYWWTFFSFIVFPLLVYQVIYWWPGHDPVEVFSYIFRWFSLSGPVYVLYKIPEWGLNMLNIFAISAGLLTFAKSVPALKKFRGQFSFKTFIALFFYYPYTLILNAIIITGVIKYKFSKVKYFID